MSKIDKAREMLIPILDVVGDKNIIDPNKIDVFSIVWEKLKLHTLSREELFYIGIALADLIYYAMGKEAEKKINENSIPTIPLEGGC